MVLVLLQGVQRQLAFGFWEEFGRSSFIESAEPLAALVHRGWHPQVAGKRAAARSWEGPKSELLAGCS
jgi:hypothetical protein